MSKMDKNALLDSLAQYGYPMLRTTVMGESEAVLENLLKQNETRLLEGFPVVFLNVLKKKQTLTWEDKRWKPGELSEKSRRRLVYLLSLSYWLFRLFGVDKELEDRTKRLLSKFKYSNETSMKVNELLYQSKPVTFDKVELSTERLKNTFRNYLVAADDNAQAQRNKHDLELELLLSELFTPRQKELLKKRLEGKEFTKTEREYFYRVVKKRLKALANDELHQLARDLVLK